MSIFTEEQAKAILDKVIKLSVADECTATLTGSVDGNIRFALNNVSTSGIVSDSQLIVQAAFGKREGIATIKRHVERPSTHPQGAGVLDAELLSVVLPAR